MGEDEETTSALAVLLLLLLLLGLCVQIARDSWGKRASHSVLLLCVLALVVFSALMMAVWMFYLSSSRDSEVASWRSARSQD